MSVDLDEGSLVDQVSWNLAEVRVRLGRSSEEGQRVITVNMSLCTALMSPPHRLRRMMRKKSKHLQKMSLPDILLLVSRR